MRRSFTKAFLLTLALALAFLVGQLSAAQPHMQAALSHLRQARTSLNKATPDKGGHRERAIALVNQAIDEVEKGINFDKRH